MNENAAAVGSEFSARTEAWVRNRWPDARPAPGSVEFSTDCAAYASGGWANFDVSWLESGTPVVRTLSESAWQYDVTQIIRELLEIKLPEVQPSFTCPRCGMTSYNPNDMREGYCGNCHDWTRLPTPPGG